MSNSAAGAKPAQTKASDIHTKNIILNLCAAACPLLRSMWVKLHGLKPYVGSLGLALGALLVSTAINLLLDVSSNSRVFLIAVLISAISYGLWPAMFAALISVVIYDFFFLPPVYSLAIHSAADIVNLAFFIVTAVVVSALAARVRRYAILADKRALTAEKLSAFTRRIGNALTVDDVLARSSEDIAAAMGTSVMTLLAEEGHLIRDSVKATGTGFDTVLLTTLEQAWAALPNRSEVLFLNNWHVLGLHCEAETFCLVGVRLAWGTTSMSPEDQNLLQAFAQQTAAAVEQNQLRQRLNDARVQNEAKEFATALLNSISHDLRGPLTTILGATSTLDLQWPALRDETKIELIKSARDESEHLNVYISNLLDMTRLEFGAIGPKFVALQLADLIGSAAYKSRSALATHRLKIDVPEELPLVEADAMLLQQAIINLMDNASKYSPVGSLITISAFAHQGFVTIRLLDEGPGLPSNELDRVFDKFFRSPTTKSKHPGTGLGLTICRGLIEAMHGTIEARNRTERSGMCISITLRTAHETLLSEVE